MSGADWERLMGSLQNSVKLWNRRRPGNLSGRKSQRASPSQAFASTSSEASGSTQLPCRLACSRGPGSCSSKANAHGQEEAGQTVVNAYSVDSLPPFQPLKDRMGLLGLHTHIVRGSWLKGKHLAMGWGCLREGEKVTKIKIWTPWEGGYTLLTLTLNLEYYHYYQHKFALEYFLLPLTSSINSLFLVHKFI